MRNFKVGVMLAASEEMGGAFGQSLYLARLIRDNTLPGFEMEFFAADRADGAILNEFGIAYPRPGSQLLRRADGLLRHSAPLRKIARRAYQKLSFADTDLEALAKKRGYNAYVFTSPSRLVRSIVRTPYIYTVWDICHRDHPEFPEFTADESFKWREDLLHAALPRSSGYIVDNERLADRLAANYGAERSRAVIAPLQVPRDLFEQTFDPDTAEAALMRHGIKKPFVFYPAQFWPHKNHTYILRGLKALKDKSGVEVGAVFCGSDYGNKAHVKGVAEQLGISNQVVTPGFVPLSELAAFYRTAIALVMPTYFGPSNIPPLEAAALGCNLIYSDLPGFRDFGGRDNLYCDLGNPDSLSDCIQAAMTMPKRQPMLPAEADPVEDLMRQLVGIRAKLLTWKSFD